MIALRQMLGLTSQPPFALFLARCEVSVSHIVKREQYAAAIKGQRLKGFGEFAAVYKCPLAQAQDVLGDQPFSNLIPKSRE
jgi:hypothetical protein